MAERLVLSREFGNALDDWGRFVGPPTTQGERPGEATGSLIRGELDRTQLDLITIDAARHAVTRSASHAARSPGPLHIIMVQLRGRSVLTPEDGAPSIHFDAGQIGYWTSDLAYRWEFDGPFTLLMLRAPFSALDLAPAALKPLAGSSFPADTGFARFVVPFAEDVLSDPSLLIGQSGTRIVQNVVSLFTTMLVGELDLAAARDRSGPSFLRVVDHVAGNLSGNLDLRTIAEATDLSPRYIQSLFHQRGTSVSEWVRLRRLEAARLALSDPALADMSVGQIAAANGFGDHAHFTRTFRAAYNETPSEWRARSQIA